MESERILNPEWLALQRRLGHTFANPDLLERALTHRSFSADHYERLEFLGDSVLGLAMSGLLYERLQRLSEGELSRIRANLVREETLFGIAKTLGLSNAMRLGEGELRSGGQQRPSILADVVEALVGAVYLDAGFEAARQVVLRLYRDVDINPTMQASTKDAKTALQEWLQGRKLALPVYRVVATHGQAHRQTFDVACEVAALQQIQTGTGASRRAAEQAAAAAMLQHLKALKP